MYVHKNFGVQINVCRLLQIKLDFNVLLVWVLHYNFLDLFLCCLSHIILWKRKVHKN